MAISAFDLFKIGIGPSSSHTVGPMRAAGMFTDSLVADGVLGQVARVHIELFGSLGATGHGHGSVPAIVLGLLGEHPESVDPAAARPSVESGPSQTGRLALQRAGARRALSTLTSMRTWCCTGGSGCRSTPTRWYSPPLDATAVS